MEINEVISIINRAILHTDSIYHDVDKTSFFWFSCFKRELDSLKYPIVRGGINYSIDHKKIFTSIFLHNTKAIEITIDKKQTNITKFERTCYK